MHRWTGIAYGGCGRGGGTSVDGDFTERKGKRRWMVGRINTFSD